MREFESPSSCYTYDHCPQKYKFRYIDKLPDTVGKAAEFGIMFENIVYERWNNGRSCTHENKKIESMLKVLFTNDIVNYKSTQNKIDVECGNSRLVGYLDMLHEDNSISDIKTSKKLWDNKKISETQQHIAYPFGAMKMGLIPNIFPVTFRYIIVTTHVKPRLQIIELKITKSDFNKYEKSFYERINKIKLEVFPPLKTNECYWCPYRNICPAWNYKI